MSKDVYRLNVRFDLTKPQEREAAAYLNQLNEIDRKSRNSFIVEAITEQIRRRNAAYNFTLDDIRQVIQEEMLAQKNSAVQQVEFKRLKQTVESGEKRILELDRLLAKAYEDNALGKLDDDRYVKYTRSYEAEQKELSILIAEGKEKLDSAEQQTIDARLLIKTLKEMTDVKELTPTLVNSLIQRIEVHNKEKLNGHSHVKVDIYFTAVGIITIPTEEEILSIMDEIRRNPNGFRLIA